MDIKRAVEVIEELRDYAYNNWDDLEYSDQLDEIGCAVDLIKSSLSEQKCIGTSEINGEKYMICKNN